MIILKAPARISDTNTLNLSTSTTTWPNVTPGFIVAEHLHAIFGAARLHDGTLIDKQARDAGRVIQQATAVAAQVQDHRGHLARRKTLEQRTHVVGGIALGRLTLGGARIAVKSG